MDFFCDLFQNIKKIYKKFKIILFHSFNLAD